MLYLKDLGLHKIITVYKFSMLFLSLLTLFNSSCGQIQNNNRAKMNDTHDYTNELIHERSPYLMQHGNYPVNRASGFV